MIHHVPDPDIGRCKNLRPDPGDAYKATFLRCLRMDLHDGSCRFPPSPLPVTSGWVLGGHITIASTPRKQWIESDSEVADV